MFQKESACSSLRCFLPFQKWTQSWTRHLLLSHVTCTVDPFANLTSWLVRVYFASSKWSSWRWQEVMGKASVIKVFQLRAPFVDARCPLFFRGSGIVFVFCPNCPACMRLQGACVWLDGVNNDAIRQECQRREAEVLWRIRGGERSVADCLFHVGIELPWNIKKAL